MRRESALAAFRSAGANERLMSISNMVAPNDRELFQSYRLHNP